MEEEFIDLSPRFFAIGLFNKLIFMLMVNIKVSYLILNGKIKYEYENCLDKQLFTNCIESSIHNNIYDYSSYDIEDDMKENPISLSKYRGNYIC
jgi:hypothetical protein